MATASTTLHAVQRTLSLRPTATAATTLHVTQDTLPQQIVLGKLLR
jgi:hypothetical protein